MSHDDEMEALEELELVEDGADYDGEGFGASEFLAGLMIGAAVGALTALLVAPQSGTRTRRELGRRARRLRAEAEDRWEDTSRDLRKQVRRGRRKLKGKIDRATKRTRKAVKRLT